MMYTKQEYLLYCDGMNLQYENDQTEDLCMIAVEQNGLALQFVKKQTDNICWAAIRQNPDAIKYVRNLEFRSRFERIPEKEEGESDNESFSSDSFSSDDSDWSPPIDDSSEGQSTPIYDIVIVDTDNVSHYQFFTDICDEDNQHLRELCEISHITREDAEWIRLNGCLIDHEIPDIDHDVLFVI